MVSWIYTYIGNSRPSDGKVEVMVEHEDEELEQQYRDELEEEVESLIDEIFEE